MPPEIIQLAGPYTTQLPSFYRPVHRMAFCRIIPLFSPPVRAGARATPLCRLRVQRPPIPSLAISSTTQSPPNQPPDWIPDEALDDYSKIDASLSYTSYTKLKNDTPWGFVVYRSTYHDNAQWQQMVHLIESSVQEPLTLNGRLDLLSRHRLTIIDDAAQLDGATSHMVRDMSIKMGRRNMRRRMWAGCILMCWIIVIGMCGLWKRVIGMMSIAVRRGRCFVRRISSLGFGERRG